MDDGRIIGVKEDHPLGDLFSDVYPGVPRQFIIGLVKEIEEGRASAELIDDVEIFIVLADSNKRN